MARVVRRDSGRVGPPVWEPRVGRRGDEDTGRGRERGASAQATRCNAEIPSDGRGRLRTGATEPETTDRDGGSVEKGSGAAVRRCGLGVWRGSGGHETRVDAVRSLRPPLSRGRPSLPGRTLSGRSGSLFPTSVSARRGRSEALKRGRQGFELTLVETKSGRRRVETSQDRV